MTSNRIILGLMTFGPNEAWGAKTTSLEEFSQFLDVFSQHGYSEVDTARGYQDGQQEEFTAAVGWKDRGLTLATKSYPSKATPHTPLGIRKQLDESLEALKTESVDIFYLHAPDRTIPFINTLEEIDKLYREKKFRQFGLSNFAAFEVAEIVMTCTSRGWVRPTVYQGLYNVLARTMEAELIPACHRYGLEVISYNALAGGLLTGKYNINKTAGPENPSQVDKIYRNVWLKQGSLEALEILEPVVQKHELSLVETALRWLIHHSMLRMRGDGGNDGILTGASSLDQLKNTLPLFEKGPLPQEVLDALDAAWRIAKTETPKYWHGDLVYKYDTVASL